MTKLLYLENWNILESPARVARITSYKEKPAITLDQTIFYPQGGGQPWDTGTIVGSNGSFKVSEVRFDPETGIVYHIGAMAGTIKAGDDVQCAVDAPRRALNSRLHSGGHIIDMAIAELGLRWKPGKGYHFPEGPYIEYIGALNEEAKESLKAEIEKRTHQLIAQQIPVTTKFLANQLINGKPARVVMYGEHAVPCGGTHVNNLREVGTIVIRKIKQEKEIVRVSYGLLA